MTARGPSPLLVALALALGACGPKPDTETTETGEPTHSEPPTETEETFPTGCITSSGGGSYASLNDAIADAADGATITLCEGLLEEEVYVEAKSVTLVGLGIGTTIWTSPSNTSPINVTNGGSATVRDLTLESSRSAAVVTDATLALTDILVPNAGSYGVEGSNADISLERVDMEQPAWGGVRVIGGTLSMTGGSITAATTAGVLVEGGVATLVDVVVSATTFVDDGSGSIADGFGVWAADGADVTLQNCSLYDNVLSGLYAQNSTVVMNGGFAGVSAKGQLEYLGIYVDTSTFTADGVTVDGAYQWGLYSFASDTLFENGTIQTDPEYSLPSGLDGTGYITLGAMGAIAADGVMTIRGSTVTGHNSCGIWGEKALDEVEVIVEGSVVDSNAERGMFINSGTLTVTDTVISNTLSNDLCIDEKSGSRSCNMAVFAIESDTVWTGGEITTSTDWGFTALGANATFDGTTFSNNEFVGLFAQDSAITLRNGIVTGVGQYGVYLNTSGALIETTTFRDRSYTYHGVNWDGKGGTYTYEYQATDLYAFDSDIDLTGSTFRGTQYGVYAYEADIVGSDLIFEGVNNPIIAAYATVELEDLDATGGGSTVVDCSTDTTVSVVDAEVTSTNPTLSSYAYFYADGTPAFSGTSSYAGATFDAYDCDLTVEGSELVDIEGGAFYAYDSTLQVDDVSVRGGGTNASTSAALYLYHVGIAPDIELSELEITGQVNGNGIELTNYFADKGLLTATDVQLGLPSKDGYSGINDHGFDLYGANLDANGIDIQGTGIAGIYAYQSVIDVDGAAGAVAAGTIEGTGTHGIDLQTSTATLANLAITDPGGAGIYAYGSTADLSGVDVTSASTWGVDCVNGGALNTCDGTFDGFMGGIDAECACDPGA